MYNASNELNGFSCGAPTSHDPSIASSNNGVFATSVPIFDDSGQPRPGPDVTLAALYSAGVHALNPFAAEGLTVTPCGRMTSVFSGPASVIPLGLSRPWLGNCSAKSRPLGLPAEWVVGPARTLGANGTAPQPVIGAVFPAASSAFTVSPR